MRGDRGSFLVVPLLLILACSTASQLRYHANSITWHLISFLYQQIYIRVEWFLVVIFHCLSESKLGVVPYGYWKDESNHRKFFDWFAQEKGISDLKGWYQVQLSGTHLYHSSNDWGLLSFPSTRFVILLGVTCLSFRFPSSPYLPSLDVIEKGGGRLLDFYDQSLYKALSIVYPDHLWLPWLFTATPHSFSKDPNSLVVPLIHWCVHTTLSSSSDLSSRSKLSHWSKYSADTDLESHALLYRRSHLG